MTLQINITQPLTLYEINKIAHMLSHVQGVEVKMDEAILVDLKRQFRPTNQMYRKLSSEALAKFNDTNSKIYFIGFDRSEFFGNVIRRFRLELDGSEPVYFVY